MASAMLASGSDDNLPSPSGGGGGVGAGGNGPGVKRGGFFSVYKKGQGYWTRMLTAVAACVFLIVVANWVFQQSRPRLVTMFLGSRPRDVAGALGRNVALGIAAGIVLGGAAIVWYVMNSARGAEFLITTDSEMKKVNWASRKEVFGSTRVVVIFLFFICSFLFVSDILFGWFFNLIGVLKAGPFGS